MCGILAGSRFGPNVRTWQTSSGEANLVTLMDLFALYYLFSLI